MNTKDLAFAYKVRHALDQNIQTMPASATGRLASARRIALSRKKRKALARAVLPRTAAAGHAPTPFSLHPVQAWLGRVGAILPLIALVFGLIGIHRAEKRQQVIETASIDAAVLTDELPLSAYLDHGFNVYLAKEAN